MSLLRCARILTLAVLVSLAAKATAEPSTLIIVIDGLRPDYVTAERMPNLHAYSESNVVYQQHHAVYPTVTRVNASSIVTGCYPGRHGLMDNAIYIPEANPEKALSAAERSNLEQIEQATGGKLLQVPTLGELLAEAGKSLFVASSGSTGSAFLLNHKVKAGAIVHCTYTLPASLEPRVQELLGPVGEEAYPNAAWNARVTDAYLKVGVDELKSPVAILWYTDPDHTAHTMGIGSPKCLEALQNVDMEFGRVLAGLKERGLDGKVNLLLTSDHGFSTGTGTQSLDRYISEYIRERKLDPRSVVRAGYGLYFKEDAASIVPDLAMRLQQLPWIGAIFAAPFVPGTPFAAMPGVLSYATVNYENPRNPDLLISPDWSDEPNAAGFPGSTTSMGSGHGSSSKWDIHNTLILGGPGFRDAAKINLPSGNVDIAPTVLRMLGLPLPQTMQGRVLEEALTDGPDPATLSVTTDTLSTQMSFPTGEGMTYTLESRTSTVAGHVYFDYARATRTQGAAPAPGTAPAN